MKNFRSLIVLIAALILLAPGAGMAAEELSPVAVLAKTDDVFNAPRDSAQQIQILLIDKSGQEKERVLEALQKGSNQRIIRFLSPADQKGIGFLSLPDDVMYLYLPAFKKTRRIASHIKNTRFAGTDYTYEDLEAKYYSDKWIPVLVTADSAQVVLQLTLKPGASSDYSKLVMTVDKSNFYATKLEMYDKTGRLYKVLTRTRIEKAGNYWIAKDSLLEDLKTRHKTRMVVKSVKFDSGLSGDKFTERYLAQ